MHLYWLYIIISCYCCGLWLGRALRCPLLSIPWIGDETHSAWIIEYWHHPGVVMSYLTMNNLFSITSIRSMPCLFYEAKRPQKFMGAANVPTNNTLPFWVQGGVKLSWRKLQGRPDLMSMFVSGLIHNCLSIMISTISGMYRFIPERTGYDSPVKLILW